MSKMLLQKNIIEFNVYEQKLMIEQDNSYEDSINLYIVTRHIDMK